MSHRLSAAQKQFYFEQGYLVGLPPVFSPAEMKEHNACLAELLKLLRPGETAKEIREWHEASRWLFDIGVHPPILDYVEGLIGPDFFVWASNFFIKEPHTADTVGWHQDAYYWPLAPHNSVTVWLAFLDSDADNGAMQVIPKSQHSGVIQHQRSTQTDSVLTLELEGGSFRQDTAVTLALKAGEVSLHDDRLVHSSGANQSNRRRVGLTIRYSGTNVKCDLAVNPHFKAYLCRGVDRFHHNPVGTVPTPKFGRLFREHRSIEETGAAPGRQSPQA